MHLPDGLGDLASDVLDGLFGSVVLVLVGATQVRANEEADKEEGEREEVDEVEPDGECLAGGVDARDAGLESLFAEFAVVDEGVDGVGSISAEESAVGREDVCSDPVCPRGSEGELLEPGKQAGGVL